MKVDSRITEEKKVRCTGCRIVILLTPDNDAPDGMVVSIPKKKDRPKGMSENKKRVLMIGALAVMAVIVAIGLWYSLSGPKTHSYVDGEVTLDNGPLIKGTIEFETIDTPTIKVSTGIVQSRYRIRAGIGKNKVRIKSDDGTTVATKFNENTELVYEVLPTDTSKDFAVTSK